MTINHNYYLNLAFQLAEKNLGKTGLNPSVGAVVVKTIQLFLLVLHLFQVDLMQNLTH